MLAAAYAPLLLLLAILDSFHTSWVRWVMAGVCAAGVVFTMLFFFVVIPRRNATPEQVYEAKPREGEALRFFATYVVPFFVSETAPPTHRWALAVYLVLIAALYLRNDLYFANPLLALLGFRVFELTRRDRGMVLVLSRAWHLAPGQVIDLVPLGGWIAVQRPTRRITREAA
jgi:hypothetical protein